MDWIKLEEKATKILGGKKKTEQEEVEKYASDIKKHLLENYTPEQQSMIVITLLNKICLAKDNQVEETRLRLERLEKDREILKGILIDETIQKYSSSNYDT